MRDSSRKYQKVLMLETPKHVSSEEGCFLRDADIAYIYKDTNFKVHVPLEKPRCHEMKTCYKVGTQFGTQKCAECAVEAVDAVYAVRIFPRKFSAC
jgi:hypothetical protein